MKEAQFEYKCRRCGVVKHNLCADVDLAQSLLTLIAINGNIASTQTGVNWLHMFEAHYCKDGGMGISDLQGFRVVGDKAHDNTPSPAKATAKRTIKRSKGEK